MNQKQHKILIIDDMASNRLALSGLITSHFEKAEITMAENGEEGLRLIENIKPDLVLLDIIMPGMDGFEVCTRLKHLDETKEIPVLLLSAVKTDSNARIKALECGAEAFLSRPVEDAELMAQIYALLREKIEEDQKEQSMLQLELLVKERTQLLEKELSERKATEIQLQQAIKSFEDQRKASINLLQDLHDEMAEKRKTQETLSSSEERFRLVFENSPLGMLTFAPDGVITACNERFVSIIGSSYEQLLGLQMLQLPDEKMVSALQQTLNGENAYYEGLYVSMTANKSTWVKVHFSPIFDKNAVITGGVGLVEDVTEQVQSEKLRQEYEDRFKKSFYSSPVAISITRLPDSMYIDINDAYCRLTGFSREQIVGHTVFELGVIDLELRQRILDEIIQGNDIHEFLVPVHTRSHDIKLVYISVEPYEMNEVKYLFTTLIDVTEQKMYEKELVKLTRAVEQSPVSIVITDLEGVIEYVNPKVIETTGYSPNELIGNNPRVLKSGEMSDAGYKKMYQAISNGQIWSGEFHNRRKNGELYWEHATISPVINDEGEMTHYIAVKEDITQMKMMQEELIENENLYRTIFEANPLPMWIYDVESLRFVEVNNAAIKDYGYTREEFLGLSLKDIRPPEDIPTLLENVASRTEAAQGPGLWRHITKDGRLMNVEIISHALPSKKGKIQRMVMAYNVTEKIAAQEALTKAKELAEQSDKLKTAFLNNISHEVRTPLNGILGATTLMNDPNMTKDDFPELLDIINLSTGRLIQTVTDYMDISLLTSGNMEKIVKPVKIIDVLDRLTNHFLDECNSKHLEFITDFPPDVAVHLVETDGELLTKALNHLLSNALKFTLRGSITFGYRVIGERFSFFVKDTGVGIEAKMHEKIFETFNQEDAGSSRRFEGSGLGLSIVKGIAEKLGGVVSVESQKGFGSVFTFSIPFREEVKKPKLEADQNKLVLIAEDEDSNYTVLEMILRKVFKAQVIRAYNGEEAVEIASSHPELSLIIMDIKMPVMDGFEATGHIKAIYPDLPIVAITAFAMSGDERRATEAGCDGYIPKPINRVDLYNVLSEFGFKA